MHPVLFYVKDDFYIGTYGVMIALGLLCGTLLAITRGSRAGFQKEQIADVIFFSVLGGIIGAKLLYAALSFRDLSEHPLKILFAREGFVFQGAILGALVGSGIYIAKHRMPFWKLTDVVAPAIPLGHFFGRLGCFSAGCCFGKVLPEDSWWSWLGVRFPLVLDRTGEHVIHSYSLFQHYWEQFYQFQQGLIPVDQLPTHSPALYPTQIIESGANLILCAALLLLSKKKNFNGQIFLLYIFFYSLTRFIIEFLRGDTGRGFLFGTLSMAQTMCIVASVGAAVVYVILRKKSLLKK